MRIIFCSELAAMMSKKSIFIMQTARAFKWFSVVEFDMQTELFQNAGKQAHGIFMGGGACDVTRGAECNERLSPRRGSFYLYASSFLRLPRSKPFPLHSSGVCVCLCMEKGEQWGGSSHTEKIANPVGKIIRSESGGACLARFYGGENDLLCFRPLSCEWMKIEPRIERLVLLLARTFRERP